MDLVEIFGENKVDLVTNIEAEQGRYTNLKQFIQDEEVVLYGKKR